MLRLVNDHINRVLPQPADMTDAGPPIILIVGPPRAGTTFALQTIAAEAGFAYLSNVAALLWARPALGLRLSRMVQGDVVPQTRHSVYGRTKGAAEPHEAGRVWLSALAHNTMVQLESREVTQKDLLRLRSRLRELAREAGIPTVLKGFHATFLIDELVSLLPELRVVRVRRPAPDVVRSILTMRQTSEDPFEPSSVQPILPASIRDAELLTQVAAQFVAIESWLDSALARLDQGIAAEVSLEDLIAAPDEETSRILEEIGLQAAPLPSDQPARPAAEPHVSPEAIDDALRHVKGLLRDD